MLSGVQFSAEVRDFTFLINEQTSCGTQLVSYSMGGEGVFAGTKAKGM
jgi:hypothetical protein